MIKRFLIIFLSGLLCTTSFSQKNKNMQNTFLEAEYFFLNEQYTDAAGLYSQVFEKLPQNANIAYRLGTCYLNIPGRKNLAIEYLENASKNMSDKRKEGTINQVSAPYDALFNLGIAYRVNYMFDKAKDAYKKYLTTLSPADTDDITFTKHEITVCDMANNLISKPVAYTEENIGKPFNDDKNNFDPVVSYDGKTFLYKTNLKFYNAVMFSRLIDGKWTAPVNISPDLKTDGEIYISSLSADGKTLYLSLNDKNNSDIYSSTYNGTNWMTPVPLNKNINTNSWESHGCISEDGQQLFFASDRAGGYGGLDLYVSHLVNGDWGPVVNLGPAINTPFNEDRPFINNNGNTLFFSSQGHENIGGYDIFRSELNSERKWSDPKNLGYPLNTPDDNIFFMPLKDEKSGYYSIFKSAGGFGKEDIFKIIIK
jgi:tetratricopeptide (TPR) repeat protein